MKVVVFGASGGTGRELVQQALTHGDAVTAYVRNPANFSFQHTNLQVVAGDVADRSRVENAVKNKDGVICALGARTLLRRSPSIVVGVHNILTAMELLCVRRFVYLSSNSVREGRQEFNPILRILLAVTLHHPNADHELDESMIRQSRLDWTIVRAPRLTNGPRTGKYRSGEHLQAGSAVPEISRADLAEFMLKQLAEDGFVRKTPVVIY